MAITQAVCTTFKNELLTGSHNFTPSTGHVIKMALYLSTSNLSASTTAYGGASATNETTGTGYTAGGNTLTTTATFPKLVTTTACVDFVDTTWTTATVTARGALIYNSTTANAGIVTLDFGADKSSSAGDFTVIFPAEDQNNAIIRIA